MKWAEGSRHQRQKKKLLAKKNPSDEEKKHSKNLDRNQNQKDQKFINDKLALK